MRFLSNKEKKSISTKLPKGYEIKKKDEIKEENYILFKNNEKYLIILNNKDKLFNKIIQFINLDNWDIFIKNNKSEEIILPHLKSINENLYSEVQVDRGAIPFIIKGADLMRPGIRKIDENINAGDIIMIKDEEHKKLLALGISIYNSSTMKEQKEGKSVIIYHYFNDNLY